MELFLDTILALFFTLITQPVILITVISIVKYECWCSNVSVVHFLFSKDVSIKKINT